MSSFLEMVDRHMPIPQEYFEFPDVRALNGQSWIPLRKLVKTKFEPIEAGVVSRKEWTGVSSAAIETGQTAVAETLGWSDGLGVGSHRSVVEGWGYCPADIFRARSAPIGVNLVIDQIIEQEGRTIWHLHPDLVVALDLVCEGDVWFRPEEGWIEVVRLRRDEFGDPMLLEIKSEFLRDYLAAREMVLYCSSYRERIAVFVNKPTYSWGGDFLQENNGRDHREYTITDSSYPDPLEHFWVRGALWRTEWVDAGNSSTRVRGDTDSHSTTFALENDGTRVTSPDLIGSRSWLYFEPTITASLLRHRGAKLHWYSGETGMLGATSSGVHFGINQLGLITVYAKDIGMLQGWEQRLWSAHNVTPDGGVSDELFAAQMMVNPAATVAPESDLFAALDELDKAFERCHGEALLRAHESVPQLMEKAHRFVAAEVDGVLNLAKELTRLFIERVDIDAIIKAIERSKKENKLGSLKALEKLVAHHRSETEAAEMMAPLFGLYDLRLADAHLGSSRVASGLSRARVDEGLPKAMQGRQLIQSFVDTLRAITAALVIFDGGE